MTSTSQRPFPPSDSIVREVAQWVRIAIGPTYEPTASQVEQGVHFWVLDERCGEEHQVPLEVSVVVDIQDGKDGDTAIFIPTKGLGEGSSLYRPWTQQSSTLVAFVVISQGASNNQKKMYLIRRRDFSIRMPQWQKKFASSSAKTEASFGFFLPLNELLKIAKETQLISTKNHP